MASRETRSRGGSFDSSRESVPRTLKTTPRGKNGNKDGHRVRKPQPPQNALQPAVKQQRCRRPSAYQRHDSDGDGDGEPTDYYTNEDGNVAISSENFSNTPLTYNPDCHYSKHACLYPKPDRDESAALDYDDQFDPESERLRLETERVTHDRLLLETERFKRKMANRKIAQWLIDVRWNVQFLFARIKMLRGLLNCDPTCVKPELTAALDWFDTTTGQDHKDARETLFAMLRIHLPFTSVKSDGASVPIAPAPVLSYPQATVVSTFAFNATEFPSL